MEDEYSIEVSLDIPQDSDGFIRRECPHCNCEFKWHDGPATDEAEHHPPPDSYNCPLCGQPAEPDAWNTRHQVELAQQRAVPQVLELMNDELESMFKGMPGFTYERGSDEL